MPKNLYSSMYIVIYMLYRRTISLSEEEYLYIRRLGVLPTAFFRAAIAAHRRDGFSVPCSERDFLG